MEPSLQVSMLNINLTYPAISHNKPWAQWLPKPEIALLKQQGVKGLAKSRNIVAKTLLQRELLLLGNKKMFSPQVKNICASRIQDFFGSQFICICMTLNFSATRLQKILFASR